MKIFASLFAMLLSISLFPSHAVSEEVRLLMIEQDGCFYCIRWHNEVGDAYHKTDEGHAAPLLRHDIRDPLPEGITLDVSALYTPTFVLLRDGREIDRIEGYPGEDFFWGLLGVMLRDNELFSPNT